MTHHAHSSHRRRFVASACAAAGSLALPVRAQSDFPNHPVRIIVPLPPGGAADVAARAQAEPLAKALKQSVVVENRPGGMFQIGMQSLMTAPADGHTLLYIFNGLASVQVTQKLFDLKTQIIPVAQIASTPIMVMVRGDSRFKSLKDLTDAMRATPEKITYASYGPGSVEHLKVSQIEKAAGVRGTQVPYKGGPDVAKALIGGEVDFSLMPAIFHKQYATGGQLRSLAVLEAARAPEYPDVPTIKEAGVNIPPMAYWGGYAVRADTPPEIVQRLFNELVSTAQQPLVIERLTSSGGNMLVSKSPQEFRQVIDSDIAWMAEAAKGLNLGG